MLGYQQNMGQHLMHSITAPEAVDIFDPEDGRGEVLRVKHGETQTLLSME